MSQKSKHKPFFLNGFLIKDAKDILALPKLSDRTKHNIIRLLTERGMLPHEKLKREMSFEFTFSEKMSGLSPIEILKRRKEKLACEHEDLRKKVERCRW